MKLHDLARDLGARAADRLDVDQTARAVLERLRAPVERRPSWTAPAILRIAALVVVLVGGVFVLNRGRDGDGHRGAAAHLVADDLGGLSTAQLQEVLTGFDQLLDSAAAPVSPDLNELDAQQLQDVLRSLEG